MPDRRMEQSLRRVWEAVFPPEIAAQREAVSAVIAPDNTVVLDSLAPSLPWARCDGVLVGAVTEGPGQLVFSFPQGGTIRHVDLSALVGPSGGAFQITIEAGGETASFSIPAGMTERSQGGVALAVPRSGRARVSVTAANGAEHININIHYTVGGGA